MVRLKGRKSKQTSLLVPIQWHLRLSTTERVQVQMTWLPPVGRFPEPAGSSDAAPTGIALSAVAGRVADNYERCHENAEQLIALQAWVRKVFVGGE
jgi:hypothetical protein